MIAGSVGAGGDLIKGSGILPSVSVELGKSMIDSLGQANYVFKDVLAKMYTDKFELKDTAITDARKALTELQARKTEESNDKKTEQANLAIQLLEVNLAQLESALKVASTPALKQEVARIWLQSVTSEFNTTIHKNASGMSFAGVRVGYTFVANIFTLGLKFENIEGGYSRGSDTQRNIDRARQTSNQIDISHKMAEGKKGELEKDGVVTKTPNSLTIDTTKSITLDTSKLPKDTQIDTKDGKTTITAKGIDFRVGLHSLDQGHEVVTVIPYIPAVKIKTQAVPVGAEVPMSSIDSLTPIALSAEK